MYLKKLDLGTGLSGQLGLPCLFLAHFAITVERDFRRLADPSNNYGPDDRDAYFTDLAQAVEMAVEGLNWPDPGPEDQGELYEMIEIAFAAHRFTMGRYSEDGPEIGTEPCESELGAVRKFLEDYAEGHARPDVARLAEVVLQAERELLTPRELATVRAAVRAYRENGYGDPLERSDRVHALACGGTSLLASMDDIGCAQLEAKLAQFTYAYRGERQGA